MPFDGGISAVTTAEESCTVNEWTSDISFKGPSIVLITYATFCDDRLRGLSVARGRIFRFPVDLCRRPYNTLALPCESVISGLTNHR